MSMGWDGTVYDQARRRAALIGAGCVILIGGGKVAFGAGAGEAVAAAPSLPVSMFVAVGALIVAAASWAGTRRAQREAARAAADLDAASQRVIVIESAILNLVERFKAAPAQPAARPASGPAAAPVASAEINVEIGLLGGLLKDIAETLAVHDRSIDTLSTDVENLQREVAEPKSSLPASETVPMAALPQMLQQADGPRAHHATLTPSVPDQASMAASAVQRQVRAEPARAQAAVSMPSPVMPSPVTLSPAISLPAVPPVLAAKPAEASSGVAQPHVTERREPTFTPLGAPSQAVPQARQGERWGDAASHRVEAVSQRVEDVAATLVDTAREEAIVSAAMQGRIELHLQPVVALPQRRVRFYETLSRLRLADGVLMSPAEFLPVLERRGLAANFDEKAFTRVLQVARHLAGREGDAGVSFNLGAASVAEPGFLRVLDRILAAHADVAGRIILEVPQRMLRGLDLDRMGMLSVLVARGVRLCVDRAVDLRIDAMSLADRGVRFLKLPVSLLLGADAARADIHVDDMAALLARAGVVLIAEKIEREEEVRDLLDLDVPMAQGFLFAVPRPVRSDVLIGLDSDSASQPPPHRNDDDQGEGSVRKPFRAFLRRAGV